MDRPEREEDPGLRVYQPGERVPEETRPASFATRKKYSPGKGPLDAPPPPPVRLAGRRRIAILGRGGSR